MGLSLGDVFLYLKGDSSHLDKTLDRTEAKTQGWAGKVGGFVGGAFQHAVGGLIEQGITKVVSGFGQAVSAGFNFNNSLEQTTARINAFTKDGQKTADILDTIRERAAKTPFEFDEMSSAAAGLLPVTKASGASLEDLIGKAEILAASNPTQGLEGAAFALKEAVSGDFTSIIERFNLPRKFINDLKEKGVPELEIVQRAMQELGLDTDLVTGLANTAQGRWSTFSDTLTNLAATVTKPIFDTFSGGLAQVNTYLEANAPLINGFTEVMAGAIQGAIDKVEMFVAALTQSGLGTALVTVFGPQIFPLFQQLQTLFGQISGGAANLGNTILSVLAPAFTWLSANALPMLTQAIAFVNQNFTSIQGAIAGVAAVLAGGAIISAIAGIAGAVLSLATPVTAIIGLAALLGAAWAGNWGNIQGIVTQAWAMIQPVLSQIWTWLGVNIPAALQTVSNFWATTLLPALQTFGQFVTSTVMPALSNLWTWLQINIPAALQTLSGFWNGTLLPAIQGVSNYIQNYTIPFFESIGNLLGAVIGKGIESSAALWNGTLLPALQAVGNFISTNLSPFFEGLGGTISTSLTPALSDLAKNIIPSLLGGFESLKGFVSDLTDTFNEWAGQIRSVEIDPQIKAHSPTPFEMGLRGIGEAIQAMPELNFQYGGGMVAQAAAAGTLGGNSTTVGSVSINVSGAGNPAATGQAVRKELESLFNRAVK